MLPHASILEEILRRKLIAVIRMDDPERALDAVEAIAAGGITVIEITLTTPGATELIGRLSGRDDLLVGAGTVLDAGAARRVFDAGALFYASPLFDPGLVGMARHLGRTSMPGAYTPTEIMNAWRSGADIIKLFPSPPDAASFIRAVRGPLPEVRLAPSGGVSASTAAGLLASGASALNVGSWLTHEPDGTPGSPESVQARAAALAEAIRG